MHFTLAAAQAFLKLSVIDDLRLQRRILAVCYNSDECAYAVVFAFRPSTSVGACEHIVRHILHIATTGRLVTEPFAKKSATTLVQHNTIPTAYVIIIHFTVIHAVRVRQGDTVKRKLCQGSGNYRICMSQLSRCSCNKRNRCTSGSILFFFLSFLRFCFPWHDGTSHFFIL